MFSGIYNENSNRGFAVENEYFSPFHSTASSSWRFDDFPGIASGNGRNVGWNGVIRMLGCVKFLPPEE